MTTKLEPRIEVVRKQYGLARDDFWPIKQNGQWVCKHAALEIVATKAGIVFDMPVIIETDAANLVVSLVVKGTMGDRSEWSTGETNKTNYKIVGKMSAYPWAMAEKRAKDRVVLKLAGIHGLVYSEDEGDFTNSKANSRETFSGLQTDLNQIQTLAELQMWWGNDDVKADLRSMDKSFQDQIIALKDEAKKTLASSDSQFPAGLPDETRQAIDNMRAG